MRLPSVLPNETLYSRLVRGLTLSGGPRERFLDMIFGSSKASIHPYLTSNLMEVASSCEEQAPTLLYEQTLFPLFMFYLPDYSQIIYNAAFFASSACRECQLSNYREHEALTLKYCPVCAQENMRKYGVTYWHLNHQIPGIEACYIHKVWLHHIPLPSRPHIEIGLLPSIERLVDACSTEAHNLVCHSVEQLGSIREGDTIFPDYWSELNRLGYITKMGRVRRKAISVALFQKVQKIAGVNNGLLPKSECDYKYISPLLKDRVCQHPFKHLLLSFFLNNTDALDADGKSKLVHTSTVKTDLESRCRTLLASGLSMNEVSLRLGKSRCYVKAIVLRDNSSQNLKPKKITCAVKESVISLARRGFHRKEIARRLDLSSGSVEQLISSVPGLVSCRKRGRFESRRRRHKATVIRFLKSNPLATRQQCKDGCNAAFFWLYHHEPIWLDAALPAATQPIRHARVNWQVRDRELSNQVIELINDIGTEISLKQLDRLLGGHGWLTRYGDRLPITIQTYKNIFGK